MKLIGFSNSLDPVKENHDVEHIVTEMRKAADCHREVRKELRKYIRPGKKVIDICNFIEGKIQEKLGTVRHIQGIGFPVGFSINNCVAHDTAHPDDTRVLDINDIVKIDFGTHVGGNIIDSAYTHAYNPKYKPLLEATKEATWAAIKYVGPDCLVSDVSKLINEVIESYEIDLDGKTHRIHSVAALGGHNILPYRIHGGKLILCKPHPAQKDMRMNIGECFAIETFASTGTGNISVVNDNHLFSLNHDHMKSGFSLDITKKMYNWINANHNTLPICSRWLNNEFGNKYKMGIRELVNKKIVTEYPPLVDIPGSLSSQLEHTIYIHDWGKEVISFGTDY